MPEEDPLLDYREIAEMTGLSESTLRAYRTQGRLPEPDELPAADRPRWLRSSIEQWMVTRPGQGTRTDLHRSIQITLALYRGALHGQQWGDGPWEAACQAAGAEPSIKMIAVRQMRAQNDIAEKLGVEAGTPVVHRSRQMLADDVVYQIHATWLPLSLIEGSRLAEPGIVAGGVFGELTRIGHTPASMSMRVGSRMPTRSEVRDMQLMQRTPVTVIERITKGAGGVVLELLRIASAGDRVEIMYEDLPLSGGARLL